MILVYPSCSDGRYKWDISLCGSLNYTCHGSTQNASVCQSYSGHQRVSGLRDSRQLEFFDGALSMRLGGGEECSSNGKNRSTLVSFECDQSVLAGEPRLVEVGVNYFDPSPVPMRLNGSICKSLCFLDVVTHSIFPIVSYSTWDMA